MSKKHVDKYYKELCYQYRQMINELKDFQELCENNQISEETFNAFKATLQPIKDSYQTISYIMYLFNMPNKKNKLSKYEQENKRILKNIDWNHTLNGIKYNNNLCLDKLHNLSNGENN